MLSAPMDTQQKEWEDDEPYKPSSTLLSKRAVATDTAALEQAADIIAKAKKPVIVVGRGAIWSGAGEEVLKVGERVGALIATSLRAKTWLADRTDYHAGVSGLYATRAAIQLFEEADCVIGIGASLNRHTTEHGYLYPNAKYVHLDPKAHIVMGMSGMPALFTSFVHLEMSALMTAENSSGEFATMSRPSTARRSFTLGVRRTAVLSLCSHTTISCAVPAGNHKPYHWADS